MDCYSAEEYELQYADDLDALSELEHLQESELELNGYPGNASASHPNGFAASGDQLPEHDDIVSQSSSTAAKRCLSSEKSDDDDHKNFEHKRFKPSENNSQEEKSICPEVVPPEFSIRMTRSDGSKTYLKLHDDSYWDLEISPTRNACGLLGAPIAELKLKALQLLEAKKSRNMSLPVTNRPEAKSTEKAELWAEKYRPQSYTELLSDESVNRTLLRWLKLWDKVVFGRERCRVKYTPRRNSREAKVKYKFHKALPVLPENFDEHGRPAQKIVLLCGPPGLGKTTLAKVVAKSAGYNTIELNASDDRSPEVFHRSLEAATQMKAVLDKHNRPNCLIIDEIDGAPSASIDVLVSFVQSISCSNMKQKKRSIPVLMRPIICICNDQFVTALKPLRKISLILNVPATSKTKLADRLYEIAVDEGLETNLTPLIILCEKADNDIRSCLSTIQFLFNSKKKLCITDLDDMDQGVKDSHKTLLNIWKEIFYAPKKHLFHEVLKSVQGFGDYEKIFSGIFENYVKLKLKASQEKDLWKGADWLCFADVLQKDIYQYQSFSMMPYLPFTAAAFHVLFSNTSLQPISYPSPYYQFISSRTKLSNLSSSISSEFLMARKCFIQENTLVLDILPMLAEVIKPSLRLVNPQLFNDKEKEALKRVVDVMISFNLSYTQERTTDGNYKYLLEPNIEELVYLNCVKQRRELLYRTKQMISREVTLEKIRREMNLQKRSSCELEIKPRSIKPRTDFFGRKLESVEKDVPICPKENESEDVVWYYFKEGFSNAVKKTVYMKDVL